MAKPKAKPSAKTYDPEFRVRVVKTAIEKKLSVKEIGKVYGISQSTWFPWKRVYLDEGEEGLRRYGTGARRKKKELSPQAQEKLRKHVLEIKKQYPFYGIARVWQWMLRSLFLPVSYRQVRATLSEANLLQKKPRKKRSPPEPRRFERAKPNQMWQTDITPLPLADGVVLQLIGFMDDHSRYLVAWGIYGTATSELVLEVLKRGIATYGKPEEVLTDNGPQYWTWRGKTVFQKFLQREDLKHIRSRRHHPKTLGKIERFWDSAKTEFLEQTKHKGDPDELRRRFGHWVNWYNFQRPQTEIGCTPAERFFQYEEAMKAEIQRRLKENEKELALSEIPPSDVIGEAPLGDGKVQVRKEGSEFIVTLGDQVVNRTDLDPKKENGHEAQEGTPVEAGIGGPGSQGEGVAGAPSPGGREDDLGGLQGDRDKAALVLQAGGTDGEGDAGRGPDAGLAGQAEGSAGRSDEPGSGDGAAPPGASASSESPADLQQAIPGEGPQTAEKRPGEAKRDDLPIVILGDNGAGPEAGPAAAPSGEPGIEEA
jgi:putative transposase